MDKHLTNIAFQSLVLSDVILQVVEQGHNFLLNIPRVKSVFDLLGLNVRKASNLILNKVRYNRDVSFNISSDLGYTIISQIPYWESIIDFGLQQKLLLNCETIIAGIGKKVIQEYENICKFILGQP